MTYSGSMIPSEMTSDGSDEKQKSHIPKEKYEDKVPARRPGKYEDSKASPCRHAPLPCPNKFKMDWY